MKSIDAFIWVNSETKQVVVVEGFRKRPTDELRWADPIGAAYSDWLKASVDDRLLLMRETVIDLVMQGFDCGLVLREFAQIDEFRALGQASYPMCRALTKAIIGQCMENVTMSFEDLLVTYAKT